MHPTSTKPSSPADSTPGRLVAAARAIFARDGFEGASVRDITAAAGANVAAVTYHFGSKEGLYHAVLQAVLSPLRDRILTVCSGPGSPLERIEAAIRSFVAHLAENPDQPRLMVQEMTVGGPLPAVLQEVILPVAAALRGVVEEGQRDGSVRTGNPFLFVLSVLSQPVYFTLVSRKIPPGLLPVDLASEGGRAVLADHVVRFALNGLRAGEE